jgi:hypothetical protein
MPAVFISSNPSVPWAEEVINIPLAGTVVHPNAAYVAGSRIARARLEGGPIRFRMTAAPTSTLGTPLYDADVVEWNLPELSALVTPGGLILASVGAADATLSVIYYR